MWWPALGGYYVGALGSCLFNNVSLLSYFIMLTPSVNGSAARNVEHLLAK